MNKITKLIFSLLIILTVSTVVNAQSSSTQCEITNKAFASGEDIKYDLYFNFGIIRARAGNGSLSITDSNYKGVNSLKTVMMLNTSGLAGSFYNVNDTLTSYVDLYMRPLLFTKEAREGGDYSVETQAFSYENDKIDIRTIRHRNGEERFDEIFTTDKCTYDYLSVLSLIRNMDFSGLKEGDRKHIQFISGKRAVNMYVNYNGVSSVKVNDGNTYEVINITMTILDDAFTNQRDALKASLTNDKNRLPVIIDTHLKIGSVRAVLKSATGLRN